MFLKSPVHEELFQKDKDVHFYTGISSLSIFHKLHSFISKYVQQLWVGPKFTLTSIKRKFRTVYTKTYGSSKEIKQLRSIFVDVNEITFELSHV